jgi:hypothetical protein
MRFTLAQVKSSFNRFFSPKTLEMKQILRISFVLAVLSLATLQLLAMAFPFGGAWLASHGIFALDALYTGFFVLAFFSLQGLLLFGFPLYYAQDQRSHMTGFRILLSTLLWMALLIGFLAFVVYHTSGSSLDAMPFGAMEGNGEMNGQVQMME